MSQHRPTPAIERASTVEPVFEVNDLVRPIKGYRRHARQVCVVESMTPATAPGLVIHTVRDVDNPGHRLFLYADELELVEKGPHRLTAEDDPC